MLYFLLVEREGERERGREGQRERERRNSQKAFSPGWDIPCCLCHMGFSQMLSATKSCLRASL
jgi:hypothetical protein